MILAPLLINIVALFTCLFSVSVVTTRNPVFSVGYLILVFMCISLVLALSGVYYLSLTYLIVYIGAVAILFLFVIMFLNLRLVNLYERGRNYTKNIPLAIFIFLFFFFFLPKFYNTDIDYIAFLIRSINLFDTYYNTEAHWFYAYNNSKLPSVYIFYQVSPDSIIYNIDHVGSIASILYSKLAIFTFIIGIIFILCIVGPIILCVTS